jgi:arginine decarboxylase
MFPHRSDLALIQKADVIATSPTSPRLGRQVTSFVGEKRRTIVPSLHRSGAASDYYFGFSSSASPGDLGHANLLEHQAVLITFNKKTGYMIDTVSNGTHAGKSK